MCDLHFGVPLVFSGNSARTLAVPSEQGLGSVPIAGWKASGNMPTTFLHNAVFAIGWVDILTKQIDCKQVSHGMPPAALASYVLRSCWPNRHGIWYCKSNKATKVTKDNIFQPRAIRSNKNTLKQTYHLHSNCFPLIILCPVNCSWISWSQSPKTATETTKHLRTSCGQYVTHK